MIRNTFSLALTVCFLLLSGHSGAVGSETHTLSSSDEVGGTSHYSKTVLAKDISIDSSVDSQEENVDGLEENVDGLTETVTDWEVTSGTIFERRGRYWTGKIGSRQAKDSEVFRARSASREYHNARVAVRLEAVKMTTTDRTPERAWDGIHLWSRYTSQYELYATSIMRRDGAAVIKKKCAGGSSNGGTYYTLASGKSPVAFRTVTNVEVTTTDTLDGVRIELRVDGKPVLTATDTGVGCAPLTEPGAVGVRGDNTEFYFDNFTVTSVG